jgi:hypothetical protein
MLNIKNLCVASFASVWVQTNHLKQTVSILKVILGSLASDKTLHRSAIEFHVFLFLRHAKHFLAHVSSEAASVLVWSTSRQKQRRRSQEDGGEAFAACCVWFRARFMSVPSKLINHPKALELQTTV